MASSLDDDSLAAYESDEDTEPQQTSSKQPEKTESAHYSVHLSGFKEFLLKPELLKAIADCGFEHPSPVQTKCIPAAILGTDLICQAKSGMGKTAVFVLACLHQLELDSSNKGASILILTHARELAYQINREFSRFAKYIPEIKTEVFYGGVPLQQNKESLEKQQPHVVIGTPGRILQLINQKIFKTQNIKHFILDECDKMLESLDMRRDVQLIFRATPHAKQVMMFSATLSNEIRPVCKKFMHHPLEIFVNDNSKLTLHGLQQYYCELQEKDKNRKLIDLLDQLDFNQLVVFVNTVDRAAHLNKLLEECNFPSTCIHSKMPQDQRIDRYRKFKEFQSRIMVATNLFGRGIDIERVNVVINYDMPENSDTYLHRVGRAGRFGTRGLAISFAASTEDAKVLNETQSRFVVSIPSLPDEIDPASYR